MHTRPSFVVLLSLLLGLSLPANAKTYHLYFLAGQSNMDGHGRVNQLPPKLKSTVPGALIYCANKQPDHQPSLGHGLWAPIGPGFGSGFKTDGHTNTLSNKFGLELAFARRIRELRPHEHVAIVKYSRGATALDARADTGNGTWDPHITSGTGAGQSINQYDHALAAIEAATRIHDIDYDGEPDTLIPAGILWMQGETDSRHGAASDSYESNLAEIAELFRAALRADSLPFVIGRISDRSANLGVGKPLWTHMDTIHEAQANVARKDPHAALVTTTDRLGYSDGAHYDTAGYLDLGRAFADAAHQLRQSPAEPLREPHTHRANE